MLAKIYHDSFLEPEVRPEYLKKLERIKKEGSLLGPSFLSKN